MVIDMRDPVGIEINEVDYSDAYDATIILERIRSACVSRKKCSAYESLDGDEYSECMARGYSCKLGCPASWDLETLSYTAFEKDK